MSDTIKKNRLLAELLLKMQQAKPLPKKDHDILTQPHQDESWSDLLGQKK